MSKLPNGKRVLASVVSILPRDLFASTIILKPSATGINLRKTTALDTSIAVPGLLVVWASQAHPHGERKALDHRDLKSAIINL